MTCKQPDVIQPEGVRDNGYCPEAVVRASIPPPAVMRIPAEKEHMHSQGHYVANFAQQKAPGGVTVSEMSINIHTV